jgi:hypothetical protein
MSTIQEVTEALQYAIARPDVWVRLVQIIYGHLDDSGDALVTLLGDSQEVRHAIAYIGKQIPDIIKGDVVRALHEHLDDAGDDLVLRRKQHEIAALTDAIADLQARINDLQIP